ncbi:MAG: hypothetical protein AB1414_16410 [bacterium]
MENKRPVGIFILSALAIIVGGLSSIIGVIGIYMWTSTILITGKSCGMVGLIHLLSYSAPFFLGFGFLSLSCGYGMLKLKNYARIGTIILIIIVGLPLNISGVMYIIAMILKKDLFYGYVFIPILILGIIGIIVWYLNLSYVKLCFTNTGVAEVGDRPRKQTGVC